MEGEEFKIFVGGLTANTVEADLEKYFTTFGQISQVSVIRNKHTGLSKCYAFIRTNERRTYQRILAQKHHIQGRMIDCKDGFSREENPQLFQMMNKRKFFVGGLSYSTKDEHLKDYFSKFGPVFKAYIITDPITQVSKRFGFVIMEDVESVEKVISINKSHYIMGHYVNCKRFDRIYPGEEKGPQTAEKKVGGKASEIENKIAMLMEEDSDSDVFNKISQLWSFGNRSTKMHLCFKRTLKNFEDEYAYYDVNNYRGPNKNQMQESNDHAYRFNLSVSRNVYQRLEDRFFGFMLNIPVKSLHELIGKDPKEQTAEGQTSLQIKS